MEEERTDRSWDGKQLLVKFKKIKLALKTQLESMKRTLSQLNENIDCRIRIWTTLQKDIRVPKLNNHCGC